MSQLVETTHGALGGDLGRWGYERRTEPGCQATLGIDVANEAWFERQSASITNTELSSTETADLLLRTLLDQGFDVDLLTSSRSGARGIRAIRDDLTMIGDFGDGGINLTVTVGPCAVDLTQIPEVYDAVEHFDPE